jgi:hypothetical protein
MDQESDRVASRCASCTCVIARIENILLADHHPSRRRWYMRTEASAACMCITGRCIVVSSWFRLQKEPAVSSRSRHPWLCLACVPAGTTSLDDCCRSSARNPLMALRQSSLQPGPAARHHPWRRWPSFPGADAHTIICIARYMSGSKCLQGLSILCMHAEHCSAQRSALSPCAGRAGCTCMHDAFFFRWAIHVAAARW